MGPGVGVLRKDGVRLFEGMTDCVLLLPTYYGVLNMLWVLFGV